MFVHQPELSGLELQRLAFLDFLFLFRDVFLHRVFIPDLFRLKLLNPRFERPHQRLDLQILHIIIEIKPLSEIEKPLQLVLLFLIDLLLRHRSFRLLKNGLFLLLLGGLSLDVFFVLFLIPGLRFVQKL